MNSAAGIVPTHPNWRRACPWLPALTMAGRIYCGPTGELLQANADGTMDVLHQGGHPHPGIAGDPAAVRVSPVFGAYPSSEDRGG